MAQSYNYIANYGTFVDIEIIISICSVVDQPIQ